MSAPTDDAVARVTRALRESEEREVDHISLNVDESDLRAVLARVAECEADTRRLLESLRLADDYIALSPCDPDIYEDQHAAWKLYESDHAMRGGA